MYSTEPRCCYQNNTLADVICQLRFPDILTIDVNVPADFQEAIRSEFPLYSVKKEMPAPKVVGNPVNLHVEKQDATNNYQFTSADGIWRVNLTGRFISLACTNYSCWEDFAKKLDVPLAAFIKIYNPAYFQRIGLRYVNFISRKVLGLENEPFSELIQPQYLGVLADDEVPEQAASRCTIDTDVAIRGGCRVKLHAGPGMVKKIGQQDNEVKFIFDQDLFMSGNIPVKYAAGSLETLHAQAYPIFRGAITDTLHYAMKPL